MDLRIDQIRNASLEIVAPHFGFKSFKNATSSQQNTPMPCGNGVFENGGNENLDSSPPFEF
jgi:hypothetical protein